MFLFKYKCINCKYNISLRVNFYYRLTFLLKFKCCKYILWDTLCTFFSLCGLCVLSPSSSSSKLLQMTSRSLNAVYQIDFSVLFLLCSYSVSCFIVSQYHGRHIIINVSRSKCEYFVFSVFDMEVCTFHEMYIVDLIGWMYEWMDGVYSLLCKTTSVFVPMRQMYLLFVPFEQLVQHVFWNRGISLQVKTVVAVYTVCCITPFF